MSKQAINIDHKKHFSTCDICGKKHTEGGCIMSLTPWGINDYMNFCKECWKTHEAILEAFNKKLEEKGNKK